jgi:carbamate kinase
MPKARPLSRVQAGDLSAAAFASGSMGPKVEAAVAFATATGKPAAIGRLEDAAAIVTGRCGTRIEPESASS